MEQLFYELGKLVDEFFFEKYGDIEWHYDGAMEKKIMEREKTDLKFDLRDFIEERFNDLDKDIEEWERDNQEEWNKKELEDIKTDMLYERNNDL